MKYKVLIFFVIGICLYVVDTTMNADKDKSIFISDQEILSLISAWKSQVGRDPTDDELARIVNNLIDEEILYREALFLGLDQEDTIIKRRLAQKISFLKEESIPKIPSVNELKEYYENNKEKYFIESLIFLNLALFCFDINLGLYITCFLFFESYPYAIIFLPLVIVTLLYAGGILRDLKKSNCFSFLISLFLLKYLNSVL